MASLAMYALGAALFVLLIYVLARMGRASDEQVAAFGPVIRAMLRAELIEGVRGSWRLHDAERQVWTSIGLSSSGVSFGFAAAASLDDADADDADDAGTPDATWFRDTTTPNAPFELDELEDDSQDDEARATRATSTRLAERLTPLLASLPSQVDYVTASPFGVYITLDLDPPNEDTMDGAEAARTAARLYPALRDWYLRARPHLAGADSAATAVGT